MDYTKYIGIPFAYGGRTTKQLDCYGLVMLLYKDIKGIDLPEIISPTVLQEIAKAVQDNLSPWKPAEFEEGNVLLFNIAGYGAHVGYIIDKDRMIHTWDKTHGVTIERISVGWHRRIMGCYKYENV